MEEVFCGQTSPLLSIAFYLPTSLETITSYITSNDVHRLMLCGDKALNERLKTGGVVKLCYRRLMAGALTIDASYFHRVQKLTIDLYSIDGDDPMLSLHLTSGRNLVELDISFGGRIWTSIDDSELVGAQIENISHPSNLKAACGPRALFQSLPNLRVLKAYEFCDPIDVSDLPRGLVHCLIWRPQQLICHADREYGGLPPNLEILDLDFGDGYSLYAYECPPSLTAYLANETYFSEEEISRLPRSLKSLECGMDEETLSECLAALPPSLTSFISIEAESLNAEDAKLLPKGLTKTNMTLQTQISPELVNSLPIGLIVSHCEQYAVFPTEIKALPPSILTMKSFGGLKGCTLPSGLKRFAAVMDDSYSDKLPSQLVHLDLISLSSFEPMRCLPKSLRLISIEEFMDHLLEMPDLGIELFRSFPRGLTYLDVSTPKLAFKCLDKATIAELPKQLLTLRLSLVEVEDFDAWTALPPYITSLSLSTTLGKKKDWNTSLGFEHLKHLSSLTLTIEEEQIGYANAILGHLPRALQVFVLGPSKCLVHDSISTNVLLDLPPSLTSMTIPLVYMTPNVAKGLLHIPEKLLIGYARSESEWKEMRGY